MPKPVSPAVQHARDYAQRLAEQGERSYKDAVAGVLRLALDADSPAEGRAEALDAYGKGLEMFSDFGDAKAINDGIEKAYRAFVRDAVRALRQSAKSADAEARIEAARKGTGAYALALASGAARMAMTKPEAMDYICERIGMAASAARAAGIGAAAFESLFNEMGIDIEPVPAAPAAEPAGAAPAKRPASKPYERKASSDGGAAYKPVGEDEKTTPLSPLVLKNRYRKWTVQRLNDRLASDPRSKQYIRITGKNRYGVLEGYEKDVLEMLSGYKKEAQEDAGAPAARPSKRTAAGAEVAYEQAKEGENTCTLTSVIANHRNSHWSLSRLKGTLLSDPRSPEHVRKTEKGYGVLEGHEDDVLAMVNGYKSGVAEPGKGPEAAPSGGGNSKRMAFTKAIAALIGSAEADRIKSANASLKSCFGEWESLVKPGPKGGHSICEDNLGGLAQIMYRHGIRLSGPATRKYISDDADASGEAAAPPATRTPSRAGKAGKPVPPSAGSPDFGRREQMPVEEFASAMGVTTDVIVDAASKLGDVWGNKGGELVVYRRGASKLAKAIKGVRQ